MPSPTVSQAIGYYVAASNLSQFDPATSSKPTTKGASQPINGACAAFLGWGGVVTTGLGAEQVSFGANGMIEAASGVEFAPASFGASLFITAFGAAVTYGGVVSMMNAMGDGSICRG